MTPDRLQDIARSLDIIRRDFDALIAPELRSAGAQSSGAMIGRLLEMLSSELRGEPDPAMGLAVDQAVQEILIREDSVDDAALWRRCDAIAAQQERRDTGRSNVAWDASYQESGAGSRAEQAPPAVQRLLTAQALTDYVREVLPGGAAATVTCLEALPGGFSKGTFIADLGFADGREETWVLRRDLSFTPLETCVSDEFDLLLALYRRGLPVAEPLWSEPDAGRLGAPLIAVRKVAGSGDMTQWAAQPQIAREIALSAARILAAIHAIDITTLPALQTAAPGCSGDTPAAVVDHLDAFWRRYRIEPNPLVELVLQWLRRKAPAAGTRGLVHGDYGLHNLLIADCRITAVLDWEFSHLGDPREDLAYTKPFIEKVLPWAEFTREYEAAGGAASGDDALRFYTVLGTLRNALGCMKVLHALRHGVEGLDSKVIYAGRSYAQQVLRSAAQQTGLL